MQAWRRHIEVVKYYVVRSLIIRGVFNEYLERSEYKDLDRFVERYFRAGQLNRREYFALPAKRNSLHMVTHNHKTETIQKYIQDRLVKDAIADQEWLTGDRIVADYIEARREDSAIDSNIQRTKKRIHDAIMQYESIAKKGE